MTVSINAQKLLFGVILLCWNWPKLTGRERWGRWMDVSRCSNNCFLCLHPWNKKPRPKCPGALACCVTVCVRVHVCLQPCMMAYKQSSALAPCTTAAERGLSHHLSPPTLYFLCPTYSSFHLLHLLLLFLTTKKPCPAPTAGELFQQRRPKP